MSETYNDTRNVVEMVDQLLQVALRLHVSDIHLEPAADQLRVRMRLDGMLQQQDPLPLDLSQQIIARLKVLAHMDVAEHRLPQDGSMRFTCDSGEVDMRISTFPSLYGEKMVIRLLDRAYHFLTFEQLGLGDARHALIKRIIDRPQGLLLVTGPTGSGKTTTLYALLDYLNTESRNIITLEDPVEYHIDGVTQGHIAQRIGFDFAQGIRALLRQDPDIIMVGEIRDAQTAKTAIHAALTGHLVLSTLHTNDAPSSVVRLVDMGVEPYLVTAALCGVIAQRLARILCPDCKCLEPLTAHHKHMLHMFGLPELKKAGVPRGCLKCHNRGYTSRVGIFECMPMSDRIRELVAQEINLDALREQAKHEGMCQLAQDAYEKVAQGIISIDELIRVC